MAEPLGVVASGIAVAQLAGSTFTAGLKLKALWDQIEGSHGTIQDLIDRIECLGPALLDAEHTFSNPGLPAIIWDDVGAQRSARYCQKALKSLTEVVDDLAAQIDSAKKIRKAVGKVKVVIKKKQLEELETRLTRAVSMLQTAQLSYLAAQSRLQPDIIVAKVQTVIANQMAPGHVACAAPNDRVSLMKNGEKSEDIVDSKQLELHGEECTAISSKLRSREWQHPTSTRKYSVTFMPPWWLASWMYAWNLTLRHSYYGWDANLRYYPVRPYYSPCFVAVIKGDLESLKTLLSTGKAGLDDQDVNGKSLLHYSILARNGSSCTEFLLNSGLRADREDVYGETPTDLYFTLIRESWTCTQEMKHFEQVKTAGLFSGEEMYLPEEDDGDDETPRECRCPFVVDASNFLSMQAVACPWHDKATLESKMCRVYRYMLYSHSAAATEVVKQMLSPEWETAPWLLFGDGRSEVPIPLLHAVASHLGSMYSPRFLSKACSMGLVPRYCHGCLRNIRFLDWESFVSGMVPYNKSLHCVRLGTVHEYLWSHCRVSGTALTWALASCLGSCRWSRQEILAVLRAWLSALQQAGIDLCKYGAEENAVLSKDNGIIVTDFYSIHRFNEGSVVRLLGFKIGPDISDWDVFFIEPLHNYSSDFWALIEGRPVGDEPLDIPGAWIEED